MKLNRTGYTFYSVSKTFISNIKSEVLDFEGKWYNNLPSEYFAVIDF